MLGLCGVLSAGFIIVATITGGLLREDYNFVEYSISELYEAGAPNAIWLMVLFTTYHALIIPFAIGLHRGLPRGKKDWIGPLLLGLAGLLGIPLGSYARCDPGCFGATTFRGQLHGVLVLFTVPLIFGAMIAIWFRIRKSEKWRNYARYTLITAIIGLAFGIGMTPFIEGYYSGLLERISVSIILQWYVIMGIRLARNAMAQQTATNTQP